MSKSWLSEPLKIEIKKVFEARYKRELTENEVLEIAENLTRFMEDFIKFKLKGNEHDHPRP